MLLIRATLALLLMLGSAAMAQSTRTARDTVSAYGARLTNPADLNAQLNTRRINNRINNRIENRIQLRIERYQVGSTADPAAAFSRADRGGSQTGAIDQANAAGRGSTGTAATGRRTPQPAPFAFDNTDDADSSGSSISTRPRSPR